MNRRTFRLFISSTFSDFRREREILQTKVFPEIKAYCVDKGYKFQPIDLRWGVNQEAQLDQKTLELCLNEARACKAYPHPNFLIMIGDRYGWVPLPYAIETTEFEILLELMGQDERAAVLSWYQEDLNQLPASYILKERNGSYVDHEAWEPVETNLRTILQETVKKAADQSLLSKDAQRKYFISATEAEVEEGIIPYVKTTAYQQNLIEQQPDIQEIDHKNIFGFFRDIEPESQKSDQFIGDDYAEAQSFKQRVKAELESQNILQVKTSQKTTDALDEHYLADFEERTISFLKQQVDAHKHEEKDISPLEAERQAQSYFAQQKRLNFIGQETSLNKILDYIADNNHQPLIIYGPSGRGKSALIAKAIEQVENTSNKQVIYRFVGATPESSSSKQILISMFDELGIDVRDYQEQQADNDLRLIDREKQESFEDFSYRIYDKILKIDKELVLFIDAVDQFANSDQFLWLPQKLPANVKIIISTLEDASYPEDSNYFQTLNNKSSNQLEIPEFGEPKTLLYSLLKTEERTIQVHQESYFLKQYVSANTPLYVSIAVQEIKHWKSFDEVGANDKTSQDLAKTQKGIIREFIENLSHIYHHDQHLVKKVLGYLYASRDGLSENELLELFSVDSDFIKKVAPETFHDNPTKELPPILWARLYAHLKPFLSEKFEDGEELLYFFHREFTDVVHTLTRQQEEHEACIKVMQKLIVQYQNDVFNSNRFGKLYAALITEHSICYKDKEKHQKYAEFINSLKNVHWTLDYLINVDKTEIKHSKKYRIRCSLGYNESLLYTVKKYYQADPTRWSKFYISTLNTRTILFEITNRLPEAKIVGEESIKLLTPLYQNQPEKWVSLYIRGLNNLTSIYLSFSQNEDAIELIESSIKILVPLYQCQPNKWLSPFIITKDYLASAYKSTGRNEEAIKVQKENLELITPFYQSNPSQHASLYIRIANNISNSYKDFINTADESDTLLEDNLKILKSLYTIDPDEWAKAYSDTLFDLANSYSNLLDIDEETFDDNLDAYANRLDLRENKQDEVRKLVEEGLNVLKDRYQSEPETWAEEYARALGDRAFIYIENKDHEEKNKAVADLNESLKIWKHLYLIDPPRWEETYIDFLENLAYAYRMIHRISKKAVELDEEIFRIKTNRYNKNPNIWKADYAASLYELARAYKNIDNFSKAIELEEQYLSIEKKLFECNPNKQTYSYIKALRKIEVSYRIIGDIKKENSIREKIFILDKKLSRPLDPLRKIIKKINNRLKPIDRKVSNYSFYLYENSPLSPYIKKIEEFEKRIDNKISNYLKGKKRH